MDYTLEQIYDKYLISSGVNTDTRTIEPDQFFVALKGENFNGNEYADEALNKGALFALVDEEQFASSDQHILVDDCLKTLQEMAHFHRKMIKIPVIGITGSNGKTTTKELMHAVLSMKYETFATKGNLNNHIGVPLSLLSITPQHQLAIIEMGANHVGEIRDLSAIADPDFGLITNIGTAHLEGFGSQENIRKGKTELYAHIKENEGTLFVNEDDAILMEDSAAIPRITYGKTSDFFSGKIEEGGATLRMHLDDKEQEFSFSTNLFGDYNFANALAAAAIGKHFGVDFMSIVEAIQEYQPDNHRSQIVQRGDITFIVDAYNANISSMRVALRDFAKLDAPRKVAILGSMLELGEQECEAHQEIVALVNQLGIEGYFVGREFANVAKINRFETIQDLKQELTLTSLAGSAVLLKGSRGIRLEKFLD